MSDLRHSGIHWPANAGGEHPNAETILSMPGVRQGCVLICADSARYWYRQARGASRLVVWRAIPRQGKLPAQFGWDARKVADEVLNLWDEQPHGNGPEWFLPLNELQFSRENGGPFPGYGPMADNLQRLRAELRKRLPGVGLMLPAWVPGDDGDHLDDWRSEAAQWDAICVHCYGSAETMRARYDSYRAAFPGKPIFVGEHNANHEGHDERAILQMWADVAARDPLFLGACWYIWQTNNDGEQDFSIWGNPSRLALFSNPPVAAVEPSKYDKPHPDEPEAPMSPDPWEFWSAERIADVAKCPLDAVRENHPRLVAQLALVGLNTRAVQAAVIGTTAIETASTYAPVKEAFWLGDDYRAALRYAPYWGRGFIQLTWEQNYRTYGAAVDALWQAGGAIDLIARPGDALDPDVSAAVFACYIRDHGGDGQGLIAQAAERGDWREVRRLVQGADAGLDRLVTITSALLSGAPAATADLVYAPDVPDAVTLQENDWSCAVRSTYAALWMAAQHGLIDPVTYGDDGPRDVYAWLVPTYDDASVGLHDHTGAGIVAALASHGIAAGNAYPVSLADVQARAGRQPLLIGGDAYGHWVAVRGLESDGTLILENPARGYKGINDELRDSFDKLGPFGMVWIDGSAAPSQPAQPSTVAALLDRLEVARAGLDDYGELPPDPGPKASKADLWAYVRNLQAWRDTVRANTDRSYQEIGAIGAALRTAQ